MSQAEARRLGVPLVLRGGAWQSGRGGDQDAR